MRFNGVVALFFLQLSLLYSVQNVLADGKVRSAKFWYTVK